MNKRILRLIMILLLILSFQQANAEEISSSDVIFSCTPEVLKDNKIECEVEIDPKESIKGIELNYEFGEEFSYLESKVNSNWEILENNSKGIALISLNGIKEKTSVAKISFVVSNKTSIREIYNVKLKNINLTNGEKDISISDKVSNIKILSLLDIVNNISIGKHNLKLEDGVNNYTVNVNYDTSSIDLTAELKNNNYYFDKEFAPRTISDLKVGENEIHLKIVQDKNIVIDYTINIVRASKEESEIVSENPKTGNTKMIISIITILILSLGSTIYLYRKNQKGEVK